jgi:hypothetical protein
MGGFYVFSNRIVPRSSWPLIIFNTIFRISVTVVKTKIGQYLLINNLLLNNGTVRTHTRTVSRTYMPSILNLICTLDQGCLKPWAGVKKRIKNVFFNPIIFVLYFLYSNFSNVSVI